MRLTYGELFAGYGGLGMGVQSVLGGEMAWCAEYDAAPSAILAHHWPNVPNLGDVTKIDWTTVPRVDVLTGGYPCQPFSHAGKRQGVEDDRHLWPYVADIVGIMRPKLCVFENVRGHLSLGFDEVLRDLHLLDYDVRWYMLRASDVGAPHGRARIFIFAEDRHARLFSGTDRRGRLHRDSGVWGFVSGQAQDPDDRQGPLGASDDGAPARREVGASDARPGRAGSGDVHLALDGQGGLPSDLRGSAATAGEGRGCGYRVGVPGDGGRIAEASERQGYMDERDARTGGDAQGSDSGRESDGTGSQDAGPSEREPGCDLPVRVVVGAGVGSVRPGGVQGPAADVWADGGGSCVRSADVGAPHGRFRIFVFATDADRVGSERGRLTWDGRARPANDGLAAPDASRERHGRGQDGRALGRVDGDDAGQAWQRERAREVAGDRSPATTPDANDATNDGERARAESLWGPYAPAIARWERAIGRPAPAPTEPGSKGRQRLSPAFVEWMMGLPAGHVTSVKISHNDQLKALGNGVVPQQSAEATRRFLLDAMEAAA